MRFLRALFAWLSALNAKPPRVEFGKPDVERTRDMRRLEALWAARAPRSSGQRWKDLDLDDVFAFVDRTHGEAGQLALYRWLREPAAIDVLHERARQAEALRVDVARRETLRQKLERLGDLPDALPRLLWKGEPLPRPSILCLLLPVASAMLTVVFGWVGLGIGFVATLAYHVMWMRRLQSITPMLEFLQRAVSSGLIPVAPEIQRAFWTLPIPPVGDELLEYVRVLLLTPEFRLRRSARAFEAHRAELSALVDALGELDALLSLASVRESQVFIEPVLDASAAGITAIGLKHPLLEDPVANDFKDTNCLLITGHNMAGKSTFLRTLGINAHLAQTLFLVRATSYRAPLLEIQTLLQRGDSVLEGRSNYLTEAEAIRDMLRTDRSSPSRQLLLLDELFRGTNTEERVAAAAAVLDEAAQRGAIVVAATHDVVLGQLLEQRFKTGFFAGAWTDAGFCFDYLLKAGVAETKNALEILERLEFPPAVVSRARALLARP